MTTQTRADLVQLAQKTVKGLTYLSRLPEQMLSGIDMACVVEGQVFPVHSYVIMSASPVFRDVTASHFSAVIIGSSQSAILQMPLDTQEKTARKALEHLYARCVFDAATPHNIADATEAVDLAVFAHKYNIQPMLEDADSFVLNSISTKYESLLDNEAANKAAEEVIEWAAIADRLSMLKTLKHSEAWLVTNFKSYQMALPKLLQLPHEIIARVMQGIANRLPAGGAYMPKIRGFGMH